MSRDDGALPPCPRSPYCASSAAGDVEPLAFDGPVEAAMARLRALIEARPRTRIVDAAGGFLHAEFRSRVFRFVDDVQCLADPRAGVIHLRSASRVGWSDLGVNRRRLRDLRAAWEASAAGRAGAEGRDSLGR